ncbi:MAG TPA: baseplate J/gp47 family protein, partial [Gaiellaceae bacterium]|nr:baseplate J/gp47 family protein [Gaiellaceae bacterium]
PIVAANLGTIGNANPGDINAIVTTMLGVTCSNLGPILGLDPPTDIQIRQLCINSLGARSVRGPRTAYAFAIAIALNSSTGTPVNINRQTISSSSHTGQITVTVASPSGVPLSTDVTGVATSIEAVARPECVTVTTQGATAVPYNAAITVYVYQLPGVTAAQVQAAVQSAIDDYFALFPISGLTADGFTGFHQTGLNGAIAASFFGVYAVDNTGGDVVMTAGQVMTEGAITITVRLGTS